MVNVEALNPSCRVDIAQLPVLDPNHPMLERFQKALKEQLLIQIDTLKSEVHEYVSFNKHVQYIIINLEFMFVKILQTF